MNLSKTELDSLIHVYVLSNTPPFLYRRMREMPAVRRIAEDNSEARLIQQIRSVGKKNKRGVKEVALAYAALVALTVKDHPPAAKTFEQLSGVDLDWARAIIEMYLSQPAVATVAEFTMPPTVERQRRKGMSRAKVTRRKMVLSK